MEWACCWAARPSAARHPARRRLFAKTTRRFPEHGNTPRTRHLVLNPLVEVNGDGATSRSTFCVVQNTESVPLQPIVVGRYHDAFARDSDGWYFTSARSTSR